MSITIVGHRYQHAYSGDVQQQKPPCLPMQPILMTFGTTNRRAGKWLSILCPISEHPRQRYNNGCIDMSFLWLAERGQFETIQMAIQQKRNHHDNRKSRQKAISDWLHASSDTPLHSFLRYYPPTPLFISLMAYTCTTRTDAQGRNLLHMACFLNCHVSIVSHLLRTLDPSQPDTRWGRLPLHWNCAATGRVAVDSNLVATATLLKEKYAQAIHERDGQGQLPHDLLVVVAMSHSKEKQQRRRGVVLPDTMVFLPPPPLRETVSDLTAEEDLFSVRCSSTIPQGVQWRRSSTS